METLPESGKVFVKYKGKVDIYSVLWVRSIGTDGCTAWSYSATTKGGEDDS
jgi:hypothetical protein